MFSSTEGCVIVLLVVTAAVGDFTVAHSKLQVYRALFDNATHALIGALSWVLVVLHNRHRYVTYSIGEVVLCTLVASLIDLDHFVAAKSFHLKDATQLSSRPALHSSTAPLALTTMVYAVSNWYGTKWGARLALLIFTAFASHHTRDATRRGYWFAPFGSTPPIPYASYIVISITIPYFAIFLLNFLNDKVYSQFTV